MPRIPIILTAVLLSFTAILRAESTQPAPVERYIFELSPTAPPTPALKYTLLFKDADRHPGNAAGLYFDAMLTMGTDLDQKFDKAEEALIDNGDVKTFISIMDPIHCPELYEELDLAARCEYCDWNSHLRERGIQALLPHLNACRMLARPIYLRAARQGQLGQVADALTTLRLGYELADKISTEPAEVSGLVSVGIVRYFNDELVKLMSRPESPNLYWALSNFPARKSTLHMEDTRLSAVSAFPALARAKSGAELSAEEWHTVLADIAALPTFNGAPTSQLDPIRNTSPEILAKARDYYARTRHLIPDKAANLDPSIILGVYYFQEYQAAYDDYSKLLNLPYSLSRPFSKTHAAEMKKLAASQPANPFLIQLPTTNLTIETFARADRELAALTTVEALRSYASTHAGSLPKSLSDLTETPAPPNPVTGEPFHYTLNQNTATLSAPDDRVPLIYTIKIRQ